MDVMDVMDVTEGHLPLLWRSPCFPSGGEWPRRSEQEWRTEPHPDWGLCWNWRLPGSSYLHRFNNGTIYLQIIISGECYKEMTRFQNYQEMYSNRCLFCNTFEDTDAPHMQKCYTGWCEETHLGILKGENNEAFDEPTGDAAALSCSNKNGNQLLIIINLV